MSTILSIEIKFIDGTSLTLNKANHGDLSYVTENGMNTITAVNKGVTTIYHVSLSTLKVMKVST